MCVCLFVLQMDGDSSTTDASQLGITGEYMASSHYVLQSQDDDAEESLNDNDDSRVKDNFREQDIYLPIANVARIMKNAVPQTGKIAKDAKECVQECVSEFISFITSEASERCHQEKRKTINGEDILFAMSTLGFDMYVEPLKLYLQKFREAMKGEKGIPGVAVGESLGEDLTDDSFTNPLPAGIITADGQQQNVMVYTTSYQQEGSIISYQSSPGLPNLCSVLPFLQDNRRSGVPGLFGHQRPGETLPAWHTRLVSALAGVHGREQRTIERKKTLSTSSSQGGCLLLHSVRSDTTTSAIPSANQTEPISVSMPMAGATTIDPNGTSTQATTLANPTMVNPTSVPVTTKPTDVPTATQPQATAPTTKPASLSGEATTVGVNHAITTDTIKITAPPATSGSGGGGGSSVVSTLPVTKPLNSNAPSDITVTPAPKPSVSTGTTVSGNQATTLSPAEAGQVGKATEKTTEAAKGQEQTTQLTSMMGRADGRQDGNTSITPSSSPLTKTSPPTAGTSSTRAGGPTFEDTTNTTTPAAPKMLLYSLNKRHEQNEEKRELVDVCKQLMDNLKDGNCVLTWQNHSGNIQLVSVEINGTVKTDKANQIYEDITKKRTDNKTLIAILASCGALLIMIVILAVCASHHRKPFHENQQHLTEELHTVENGYHDNPTLEVMEVQPEMQEKKMALNGEFNDSWIVPIDNLLKEDMPDEEDTHL
ncbi:hypothetical protein L3Q82_009625 [Scortum barcoo]|uniref:Uncharacterized protein n=1 Tax=Scortum barcoo TaxID=214431 RepID=A0ACB8WGM8_9TELE|nr:hypothetical protein L3Q82_009625 [Scortum barcoo]